MSTEPWAHSSLAAQGSRTRINRLSMLSIVLAILAFAGMVLAGIAVLAVFAVGAGHMSLHQIKAGGEQGAALSYVALGLSYAIGIYGLLSAIAYTISMFSAVPIGDLARI